ncbi:MAG TPA: DNA gyrase inhibitor YacG [Burkholderiales bacterium]|nr:DNA gyrase inhibitor YacG [Burkholderiales bacterium]
MTTKTVPCPRCGTLSLFAPANPWRPFCSERCKTIDLGAWASESYRVAGPGQGDPEKEPTE